MYYSSWMTTSLLLFGLDDAPAPTLFCILDPFFDTSMYTLYWVVERFWIRLSSSSSVMKRSRSSCTNHSDSFFLVCGTPSPFLLLEGGRGKLGGFLPSFSLLLFSGENWRSGEERRPSLVLRPSKSKLIFPFGWWCDSLSAVWFGCYAFPLFFSSSVVIVKELSLWSVIVVGHSFFQLSTIWISLLLFFFFQRYRANQVDTNFLIFLPSAAWWKELLLLHQQETIGGIQSYVVFGSDSLSFSSGRVRARPLFFFLFYNFILYYF